MAERVVEVVRSGIIESVHYGDIAVADSAGRLLYKVGEAGRTTFFRSSAKPLIVIAGLETGIADEYMLSSREIAIMASSHSGEKEHVGVLAEIMKKIGVTEDQLECGVQMPTGRQAALEMTRQGESPTRLHCNCSGKHLSVIAAAKRLGLPVGNYISPDHEIQKYIQKVIAHFCSLEIESIKKGVDGCGIPVYAIPLRNMATAYANLCNERFAGGKYKASQKLVIDAMTSFPEMVGGTGREDTRIMKHFGDRVVSKMGAEAVHCMGLRGKGIGIAVKIRDGSSRAVSPAAIEILVQMGIITKEEANEVRDLWYPPVYNHRGECVGEIRPYFSLEQLI